ncbi:hypothetical protein [Bacteroides sp.]|uniref:hypothetical protein n=1 Tax=Bacteroides sp. TaxID=29523 RepID=UPI00261D2612|nr:hypothetical protein [Bacteroides sp.]MDD3040901.1 hypothetical protein [Bacteroides sp.]
MKTYAVIYISNGSTSHVDVYFSKERAKSEAIANGGSFVSGILNIINACTWWRNTDSMYYRRKWVLDNRI